MMKEKMRKYFGMAYLLAIMPLFPVEWYKSAVPSVLDADGIESFFQSINGIEIFTFNGGSIFITYTLCLLIQYLVIENHKGYVIAIISKILLIFQFITAPLFVLYSKEHRQLLLIYEHELFLQRLGNYIVTVYRTGFYLATVLVIVGVIHNIMCLRYRNKKSSQIRKMSEKILKQNNGGVL